MIPRAAPLLVDELLATNVQNTFLRLTSFSLVSDLHWTLMFKQIMVGCLKVDIYGLTSR